MKLIRSRVSAFLLISLLSVTARAIVPAGAPPDPRLWSALVELNARVDLEHNARWSAGTVVLAAPIAAAGVAAFLSISNRLNPATMRPAELRRLARAQALAATFAIGFGTTVLVNGFWTGVLLANDLIKHGWTDRQLLRRDVRGHRRRTLNSLAEFLNLSLVDQYRVASQDAGVREYVIELRSWLRHDAGEPAPPPAEGLGQLGNPDLTGIR